MFDFFKKSRQSKKTVRHQNRGKYQIVSDWGSTQIAPSTMETRTEDEILNFSKRARLIDLTRNLVRNSNLFNTILGQLTTNVVSTKGGKVIANFADEQVNKMVKKHFSEFTKNADFFSSQSFNHILKRCLRESIITGDCVLVYDDGIVEDSGKILFFEAEEIVGVDENTIQKHYGKGAYQTQGKVYNRNGRWIGTVVSRACRSQELADPSKCWFLKRDPNGSYLDNYWFQVENAWRDGRGVSQAASAIGTIHSLEDLVTSELLASKRNSQLFCWLTQNSRQEEELPSAFDENADFDSMTDAQIEAAAKKENENTQVVSFHHAKEQSIVYEALPEGVDAKQLQTQHPNSNVEAMVDFLANRCAATLGLSKVYATGNPEDGSWRANQLFSIGAIVEFQKELEKICDWALFRTLNYLTKTGVSGLPIEKDELFDSVSWEWSKLDDLDENAHQDAISKMLANNTASYKDILGSNWKEKLLQIKEEVAFFKENNLPHPSYAMKSGGERSESIEYSKSQQ